MDAKTIGRRIRMYREKRSIKQAELADRAELSQPYVSQLEHGQFNPTVTALIRISKVLEVPLGELTDEEERRTG